MYGEGEIVSVDENKSNDFISAAMIERGSIHDREDNRSTF